MCTVNIKWEKPSKVNRYRFSIKYLQMMVFVYEDESVRVVVHTANLVGSDWENRTQGVWVSPRLVILVSQFFCGRNPIFLVSFHILHFYFL